MKNDYSCQTSCQSMNNVHNAPLAKTLKSLQGKLMLFSLRLFQVDFQARAVFLMRTSRPDTIWHLRKTLRSQGALCICLFVCLYVCLCVAGVRIFHGLYVPPFQGVSKWPTYALLTSSFPSLLLGKSSFFMGTSRPDIMWHLHQNQEFQGASKL